ncbi:Lrp/AsnC family transcriptional regulator [Rhizobium sp. L1K21]|uniref:Lrp/AsnC family transcriptional regulator n=1 Tax=Rhizobium sp. L1K21 TaxID=2954933 RepID=UPI0020931C2B|nr:Lrp/AsnC family transcriptional regulator [Rhizobium sp. L1K21]MCO6185725.1 Lrp/AsnC family transcriptional regulator [Rhizobium sp. L1K21]
MIDDRDRKILRLLQQDATIPLTQLSEAVSLSVSACSRRVQRLEEEGYISSRSAVLDRNRMGVPTTLIALIKTARHDEEWLEQFRRAIVDIPEIIEAHRVTGSYDYILTIALPNAEHYDTVYKRLVSKVSIFEISASISMETLKSGRTIPVSYAA